ncbi:hypothetical protein SUGI_0613460 [Cryptomeria japonica]|nr:hypothetical protein SUGI_0613460 [Cryptomeria japonica]
MGPAWSVAFSSVEDNKNGRDEQDLSTSVISDGQKGRTVRGNFGGKMANLATFQIQILIPLFHTHSGEALVEIVEATFIRTHHNEKHSGSLREHSTMMYSCYWCVYGLDDHRNDPPTKEFARNFRKKRGSQCHIIVKVMKGRPDVAILIFNQRLHVDAND